MIKILRSIFALAAFILGTHAYAQIPVTDSVSIAQQIQQVAAWGKQFAQMEQQFNQLQSTYTSLSGIRGMASLVNNPALRNYIPPEYQSMLNGLGMSPSLSGSISALQKAAKLIGPESTGLDPDSDSYKAMQNSQNQNALNRAIGEEGYRQASARFNDIQVLLNKVNAAPEEKDILDLQGRIQAEQVMMQNEQSKLQMMTYLTSVQRDIAQQQAREITIKAVHGTVPRF